MAAKPAGLDPSLQPGSALSSASPGQVALALDFHMVSKDSRAPWARGLGLSLGLILLIPFSGPREQRGLNAVCF
jgi:hypothetical protein